MKNENRKKWETLKVPSKTKDRLDLCKELEREKKGKDPSYGDVIETALLGNLAKPDEKKKKGKKKGDFLEIF